MSWSVRRVLFWAHSMVALKLGREGGKEMGVYVGLNGVDGGTLEGPTATSISGFKVALRVNRVCSAAGNKGAVTVWQDDEGAWHCAFTRFCAVLDEHVYRTKAQVWAWLTEWMPKCDLGMDSGQRVR